MIKKVLIVCFLFFTTLAFSQKSFEQVNAVPNPFVTNTKIFVESKTKQTVFFSVKNILGRTIYSKKVLVKKGENVIPFAKDKLRSGVYIYTLKSDKESISKRLVIQ